MSGLEKRRSTTNQEFVVGNEIHILLKGGDEIEGIIDAVEVFGTDALVMVDVAGVARTFTYTEGVWEDADDVSEELVLA